MSQKIDMDMLRANTDTGLAILELIEAAVKAYHSSIGIDVDPIGPEQDEQRLWNAVHPFIEKNA